LIVDHLSSLVIRFGPNHTNPASRSQTADDRFVRFRICP
jgi:hypothetical protein